ncbi:MAG: pentapeptide repeat-containing protein [Planctomycetaceae bacterium]|nr:pentapeptide repeat-containing protein [Planctomycetaceae bacterium]
MRCRRESDPQTHQQPSPELLQSDSEYLVVIRKISTEFTISASPSLRSSLAADQIRRAIDQTTMRQTTMRQTTMRQTTLRQTTMRQTTLRQTTLRQTTLRQTTLRQTTLRQTTLCQTTLCQTTLCQAKLTEGRLPVRSALRASIRPSMAGCVPPNRCQRES